MSIKRARVLILLAACLTGLMGCSSAMKIGDLGKPNDGATADGAVSDSGPTTGSVVVPPAESGPNGEPIMPLAKPGLLGSDPNDDLQLGKKYFRSNNFGLAEKSFRSAAEKHPRDAEAWVGLAASYDRLHRFDLADRAYQEAIHMSARRGNPQQSGLFLYAARRLCTGEKEARGRSGQGPRQSPYPGQYALARR